jgi:hypothetical protein
MLVGEFHEDRLLDMDYPGIFEKVMSETPATYGFFL